MNIREFNVCEEKFAIKTGKWLLESVQKYWLSIWYFIDSYEELIDMAEHEEQDFNKLIRILEWMYVKRNKKIITDKRIIYAFAISLYNTHIKCKRKKIEESYVSDFLISQDEAKDILLWYWDYMWNPLAFAIDCQWIYYSLINWQNIQQIKCYVSNWKRWNRATKEFAQKWNFWRLDIDHVNTEYYHPTVWYILKNKKLWEYNYLFNNSLQLCEKWIQSYTQKQLKIVEA